MNLDAEILGHRMALDGTLGELLHLLRAHHGQTRVWQRHHLRMSEYAFRRLETRPIPPAQTFAAEVLGIARDCQVAEPARLVAMLTEGLRPVRRNPAADSAPEA